jgi:thioredoxin reductase (NADPH)
VIIIGQGPGAYSAGIYAARRNLKTLLIGETPGGKMAITDLIENYAGFEKISGLELTEKMKKQAKKSGCEIKQEKVTKITLGFKVYTSENQYDAKSIIIVTGTVQRKLNIEGEDQFLGKGVSYCATCDGPLFKGKTVAIIGGSNSAVKTAIYLSEICKKVYIIHRKDMFRAEEKNVENMKGKSNVEILFNSEGAKINGDKFVKSLTLKDGKELEVDGVFIAVGVIPIAGLTENLKIKKDKNGFILINNKTETNVKGVFAAGDITGGILQIAQAVGQGAIAGTQAYFYVKSLGDNVPYFVKK